MTVAVHGRGRTVEVAEVGPLYYEIEGDGDGPPVVLVGGGPGVDHAHYHPWFSGLSNGRSVIYYDHPGTGRSVGAGEGVFSVPTYAKAIEGLREHLELQSLVLLGVSFGGFPAIEYAAQHADRVSGLVLSNAHVDAQGWQEGNIDNVNRTLRTHFPETWTELVSMREAGVRSNDAGYQELVSRALPRLEWADLWTHRVLEPADSAPSWAAYESFVGADPEWEISGSLSGYTAALEELDVPALVLAGRHDGLTLPRVAFEQTRRLPRARLHVFERSGHRPWCEEPDAYVDVLTAFLASLPT